MSKKHRVEDQTEDMEKEFYRCVGGKQVEPFDIFKDFKPTEKTNIRIQETIYNKDGEPIGLSKPENVENENIPKYIPVKMKITPTHQKIINDVSNAIDLYLKKLFHNIQTFLFFTKLI